MENMFKNQHLTDNQLDEFVDECLKSLATIQNNNIAKYHLGDGTWNVDLEAGTITFTQSDQLVVAKIQVVGTLNNEKQTFMWAWDHPSIPKKLSENVTLLKQWGEVNSLPLFMNNPIICDENQAWEFTALMCKFAKAEGAYIGRKDNISLFLIMHDIKTIKT
jgi:uncharacterized protein DUF6882